MFFKLLTTRTVRAQYRITAGCGIQNAVNRFKRGPEASSNETQPIIRSIVVR